MLPCMRYDALGLYRSRWPSNLKGGGGVMPSHHPAEQERKMMKKLGFNIISKHIVCQKY
jgi:hypothetical protein